MALTAKEKPKSLVKPIPAGLHVAIAYLVADLGTHKDATFGGLKHKLVIGFEIPDQRIELEKDGKKVNLPRAISARYTLSLGEKANLRRDLESWRGKPFTAEELKAFDLKAILGAPCQLLIVHNVGKDGETYANIQTIVPLGKGATKPKLENPPMWFSFEELTPSDNLPEGLPEWIAKIVKESEEWKSHENPQTEAAPAEDDFPPDAAPPPDVDDGVPLPF